MAAHVVLAHVRFAHSPFKRSARTQVAPPVSEFSTDLAPGRCAPSTKNSMRSAAIQVFFRPECFGVFSSSGVLSGSAPPMATVRRGLAVTQRHGDAEHGNGTGAYAPAMLICRNR